MDLKRLQFGPYELCMMAIVLLTSLLRIMLIGQHWPVTNSDEGVMDLMALHIANRGEHPIFFYGQAYMGVLEAYIGAFLFQIFGASVFALRLGLIPFYALFLVSMYFLTRLLYNRQLALVTILLLGLGSSDIITRQLKAIGGYPETFFFAALIFLLASKIALSSGLAMQKRSRQAQRRRWLLYTLLGFIVGLSLWTDQLILPFIATTGLLLLLFCRREVFSLAGLYALLGIIIGALPLIYYNLTSPFEQNSLIVLLNLQRSGIGDLTVKHVPRIQQLIGAFFISLAAIMALNPLCGIGNFPLFGQITAQNVHCTIVQGGWSLGYITLWIWAALLAGCTAWRFWRQRMQQPEWPCAERQKYIQQCARLLLLLSAALSFLLYATSPGAALSPATNTRYLICMLVALPAVLWPLLSLRYKGHNDNSLDRDVTLKGLYATLRWSLRGKRWSFSFLLRGGILLLIVFIFARGTINVLADIPNAQETYSRQQALVEHLEQIGATRIYTDYWTCYRIAFQSNEKIICANLTEDLQRGPDSVNRYTPYYEQVEATSQPTYVFPKLSIQAANFVRQVQVLHTNYRYSEFDDYVIYQYSAPIGIP